MDQKTRSSDLSTGKETVRSGYLTMVSVWKITCNSCRCQIQLVVQPYPSGPSQPILCPICGIDFRAEGNSHCVKQV